MGAATESSQGAAPAPEMSTAQLTLPRFALSPTLATSVAALANLRFSRSAPQRAPTREAPPVRDASDAEDIEQVRAFLAGDQRGFETLFDKYRERVYCLAYRYVRNKEDALEVTQDVFLRVFQNIAKFKLDSKFFTWLYRITSNRAIDFTRSRRARPSKELEKSVIESQETDSTGKRAQTPVEVVEQRELGVRVNEAIETLSEKHRAVFVLHAKENLSYKEIAEVMDCSIGTVMSRLFYARKKLQERLAIMGIERPGRLEGNES